MALTHKQKVKLARKLRTPAELRAGVPIFQTDAWYRRSSAKMYKWVEIDKGIVAKVKKIIK